ncbi:MAG: hypothetical protein KGN84_04660 [Acidobacteriota bacterium]|nr:hypothetical protein [Acidobacteriota bacterium]
MRLRVFAILPLMGGIASGQVSSYTISSFNLNLTNQSQSTYISAFSGSGTAVFTGLPVTSASVSVTGTNTRDRGLDCGDLVELNMTISFSGTDTLSMLVTGPTSGDSSTVTLTTYVTGGTGAYANRGGAGTFTATQNGTVITGTGAGMLTTGAPTPVPVISPGGIVPLYGQAPLASPGSWISIYGSNLAETVTRWNGDFPTQLGNVSVTIDNKPAYLWYVSPGQINAQIPDDNTNGCVNVVVTTPNGAASGGITLQSAQPSFSLLNGKYAAGVIPAPNGGGAYGSGANSYDIVGPVGAFSYSTRPVKVGETLVLYGVGFGPTNPPVPAGQVYSGASPITNQVIVYIGGQQAPVAFAGLVGAGLYQLNVTVPRVSSGDQQIRALLMGPAITPPLFSADMTQTCDDPDPGDTPPSNCAVYVTVQ